MIPILILSSLSLCTAIRGRGQDYSGRATCVEQAARDLGTILGLARPIAVTILPEGGKIAGSEPGTWAWATRDQSIVGGCRLTFAGEAAQDLQAIAHEVCHCRYDFDLMTTTGAIMSRSQRKTAEDRAEVCSYFLTMEDQELERMRREKQIPDWGTVIAMSKLKGD